MSIQCMLAKLICIYGIIYSEYEKALQIASVAMQTILM